MAGIVNVQMPFSTETPFAEWASNRFHWIVASFRTASEKWKNLLAYSFVNLSLPNNNNLLRTFNTCTIKLLLNSSAASAKWKTFQLFLAQRVMYHECFVRREKIFFLLDKKKLTLGKLILHSDVQAGKLILHSDMNIYYKWW